MLIHNGVNMMNKERIGILVLVLFFLPGVLAAPNPGHNCADVDTTGCGRIQASTAADGFPAVMGQHGGSQGAGIMGIGPLMSGGYLGYTTPGGLSYGIYASGNARIAGDLEVTQRLNMEGSAGTHGEVDLSFAGSGSSWNGVVFGPTGTYGFLDYYTDSANGIRLASTGPLRLGISGGETHDSDPSFTEVIRIQDSNKYVGIGNTNPTEKLDVTGNILASGSICDSAGNCVGSGSGGGITCNPPCAGPALAQFVGPSPASQVTSSIVQASANGVGIGAGPQAGMKLYVTGGPVKVTDSVFANYLSLLPLAATPPANAQYRRIFVKSSDDMPYYVDVSGTEHNLVSGGSSVWTQTGTKLYPNDQTWNVGAGTVNPQTPLHVKGNGNIFSIEGTNQAYIQWYPEGYDTGQPAPFNRKAWAGFGSSGTHDFTLANAYTNGNIIIDTTNGNVGIDTSSPDAKLHVATGSDASLSGGGYLQLGWSGGYNMVMDVNDIMARNNGAATGLRLQPEGGFVGIGTRSPSYTLDVAGTANLNKGVSSGVALRVNDAEAIWYNGEYFSWGFGGNDNYFSDNVGIGVTDPQEALDVNGDIQLSGAIKSSGGDVIIQLG